MIGAVRRNTELGLLVLSSLVTVGAYVLASLPEDGSMPANIVPFLGVVLGLQLAAHVAVRKLAPRADGMLLPLATLLAGLGYVFIVRLDEAAREPAGLAGLQTMWMIVGMAAFVGTLVVVRDVRMLERMRYTAGLVGIVLLLMPLLPVVGQTVNGSRIWVSFGPINFQPGEFAKIALAIFFAGYLVEKADLLRISKEIGPIPVPDPKHLGPVLVAWGASLVVMVAERDLGSSLLFFALFLVIIWVATQRVSYLVVGLLLFAVGATFAHSQFTHVQARVDTWLDPWPVADGAGFQVVQSAFALADGGITGTGIGLGEPLLIPEVETDFIFAAIGEELGLLGAGAIIITFLLIIGAGLRIAQNTSNGFEQLLATGLTLMIGLQAFIIMGGVVRLMPLTGVTLPFVSYGGSSLLANFMLLALLMRISDEAVRREEDKRASLDQTQLGAVS
jgi:cell division protein FtsW (lipid II flippase)